MSWQILQGDCLSVLRTMPSESVQCCITSPPYYGLRSYGTPPKLMGGDESCVHEWVDTTYRDSRKVDSTSGMKQNTNAGSRGWRSEPRQNQTCAKCGAWFGHLGLEPKPEMFVDHIVEIFREVRRVMRDDAVLWLNFGDTYAANRGYQVPDSKHTDVGNSIGMRAAEFGLKPKDMMGIPWAVAFALRADGWYLRAACPWIKRNAMPESCDDRPTTAIEYVFLLSKSLRYFYDTEAVMMPVSGNAHARGNGVNPKAKMPGPNSRVFQDRDPNHPEARKNRQNESFSAAVKSLVSERARRSYDWFMDSWEGLLSDDEGEPLAFVVNATGFEDAHFATFPPKLVEPCVFAGSHEGDTVLDPFNGSGTTGLVATRLGRNYIGIELNPSYVEMAERRIINDAPLFNSISALSVPTDGKHEG